MPELTEPGPEELSSGQQDAAQRDYEREHRDELCTGCGKPEPAEWCWAQKPECPMGRPPRWPAQNPPASQRSTPMTVRVNAVHRHPGTAHLLGLLRSDHLPAHLRAISRPIEDVAHLLTSQLNDGPELTTGLRKLLEAKDCLVRQAVIDAAETEL